MRFFAVLFAMLGLLCLPLALTGCEEPGPAERMGESIDDAGEEIREGVEDLGNR